MSPLRAARTARERALALKEGYGTPYKRRVALAAQKGISKGVAVGKPRKGEVTLTEKQLGFEASTVRQTKKYAEVWRQVNGLGIPYLKLSDKRPTIPVGTLEDDPFYARAMGMRVSGDDVPMQLMHVYVARRRR